MVNNVLLETVANYFQVTDETRSYFLNEVDGLESNDGILMIGSTNHLNRLDPAISKRPSRFDRKYHFNLPGEAERAAYAEFWKQKLVDSDMVDFQEELCEVIAKLTEGFSFAYLKELFVIVLLTIARGGTGDEVEEEVPVAPETSPSEDGHVVVEHEDAKGESGDDGEKKEEDNEEEKEAEKPAPPPEIKRVMPEVEIPESLRDNVLLKVVKCQIKMLLDEMDNTEEGKWPSEKTQGGGVPGHKKPVRVRRARRAC
jgi:SpoVK/Ycf46/Vps4 family AAA+-type ATPase